MTLRGLRMAIPLDDNFDRLADFGRVESVGVIVDVGDLLSGELYYYVSSLQAGSIGGAIAANSRKFYPRNLGRIIRNRANVDAQVFSPSARAALFNFHEIGPGRCASQIGSERAGETTDARQSLVVKSVGCVGGPVVVLMRTGEEIHEGYFLEIKRRAVGRQIRVVL